MEIKQKKWSRRALLVGIASAVLTGALFMCSYIFYAKLTEDIPEQAALSNAAVQERSLETELNKLFSFNYVLYRELYEKRLESSMETAYISYNELYFSQEIPELNISDSLLEYDREYYDNIYVTGVENIKSAVSEYLTNLEQQDFSQLNEYYDYWIEDFSDSGVDTLTNTAYNMPDWVDPDNYAILFQISYGSDGSPSISDWMISNDTDSMRRSLNILIHADEKSLLGVVDIRQQYAEGYALIQEAIERATQIQNPRNCTITYGLPVNKWNSVFGDRRSYDVFLMYFGKLQESGMGTLYVLFAALILLFGWIYANPKTEERRQKRKLLRLPSEVMLCGGVVLLSFSRIAIEWAASFLSGIWQEELNQRLFSRIAPASYPGMMLALGLNFVYLSVLFFLAWYVGACLGELRLLGVKGYFGERCLCCRYWSFLKAKCRAFYDSYVHMDLSRSGKKKLLRLIIINAVLISILCCGWFLGLFGVVIYSFILYCIITKYMKQLQRNYRLLYQATEEIAAGNLQMKLTEDLGVYEPVKRNLLSIQDGFDAAVKKEVRSQRMKTELITNVSHDLKTPLTAIITYINLLKEPNLTEEQRRQYLDTLERKSLRLKTLIEDLFEVSKANSGNVTLTLQEVDLGNLIKQVAFEVEDKMEERNLIIKYMLPEEKITLRLDSQKTYRIYENLFGNIVKYAMPGTRVYVIMKAEEKEVSVTLKNIAEAELSVSSEELTERFVRGDASRGMTEGSGLGLAIAKSFMELQGGRLDVSVDGDLFKVSTVWKV